MNKITSLSYFKADASRLLLEIHKSGETIVITQNGEASAVIQDIESYKRLQNALLMLKLLATGESDIHKNKLTDHADLMNTIKKKLHSNE